MVSRQSHKLEIWWIRAPHSATKHGPNGLGYLVTDKPQTNLLDRAMPQPMVLRTRRLGPASGSRPDASNVRYRVRVSTGPPNIRARMYCLMFQLDKESFLC